MEVAIDKIKGYILGVFIGLVSAISAFLLAPLAESATLEHLEASPKKDSTFQLKLDFDAAPPELQSYTLQNPARIVVDLPDTLSEIDRYHEIGKAGIERVTVVQAGGRTRLIIALEYPASFTSTVDDRTLLLTMTPEPKKEHKDNQQPVLRAVDFQRGKDGAGNIVFLTSSVDAPVSIDSSGQRLMVNFPNLDLPEVLKQRLDVTEFATPVQFIRLKKNKDQVQAFIELNGKYEYLSWQSGKKFTLSVHEIDKGKKAGSGELTHVGEKLSLNFQDIEIRAVLQLLADEQNFNLVASDAVKGNVTLRLEDVPWDQALNIILRSKGLDKRLEGNVLIVAPAQELASRERQSLESSQKIKDLSPLHTELIQVNYAKASNMASVLQGSENNRILSERGSVQVVERTNSLLINETKDKLVEVRALMAKIDIPVQQVMIEARIVEARTNLREELGVAWGNSTAGSLKQTLPDANGRSVSDLNANLGGSKFIKDLFVSLPTTGASSGIRLGYVTNSVDLSLQLSALEVDSKIEIISQPQIITVNKKKAVIKKGEERAFETTSDQGTNTTFKDVSLSLEVTPQITPDGRVIMDVDVTNNEVTGTDTRGNPITSINEINTQLLVNNGQTVVLGGIFKNTLTKSIESVPLLGKLPGIGRLFSRDIDRDEKSELLIFITPRIIIDKLAKK